MDYLVEFIITIPDDAPLLEIEQRVAAETTRVAKLRRAEACPAGVEAAARRRAPPGTRPVPRGIRRGAGGDLDSLPLRPGWRSRSRCWPSTPTTRRGRRHELAGATGRPSSAAPQRVGASLVSVAGPRPWRRRGVGSAETRRPRPPKGSRWTPPQPRAAPRLPAPRRAGRTVDLGGYPQGHRGLVPLTRGHEAGPYFDAELLPAGGADWQIVRASGSSVADIRYALKTDAGALLYVQSQGVRHGDPTCSPGWPREGRGPVRVHIP